MRGGENKTMNLQEFSLIVVVTAGIVEVLKRWLSLDAKLLALLVGLVLIIAGIFTGYLPKSFETLLLGLGAIIGSGLTADKLIDPIQKLNKS